MLLGRKLPLSAVTEKHPGRYCSWVACFELVMRLGEERCEGRADVTHSAVVPAKASIQ
jgi:hypothetical protein